MVCEICNRESTTKEFEGVRLCMVCATILEFLWYVNIHYQPIVRTNVHMNGCPAATPRPYGQLPGNGN